MISFTIPGEPVPKGRPRFANGRVYTPPKTVEYERKVRVFARNAKVRMLKGDIQLIVDFHLKTERRVDIDNLVKGCMDALNGIAWKDDAQVVSLVASKLLGSLNPRCAIQLGEAGDTMGEK